MATKNSRPQQPAKHCNIFFLTSGKRLSIPVNGFLCSRHPPGVCGLLPQQGYTMRVLVTEPIHEKGFSLLREQFEVVDRTAPEGQPAPALRQYPPLAPLGGPHRGSQTEHSGAGGGKPHRRARGPGAHVLRQQGRSRPVIDGSGVRQPEHDIPTGGRYVGNFAA